MFHQGLPVLPVEIEDIQEGRKQGFEINTATLIRRKPRLISRQRLWNQSFAVDFEHLRGRLRSDVLIANIEVSRLNLTLVFAPGTIKFFHGLRHFRIELSAAVNRN